MYIKYEGISFDAGWIASMKQDDFLKSADDEGHKHWFEGDKNRKDKLKEVYNLAKKQAGNKTKD